MNLTDQIMGDEAAWNQLCQEAFHQIDLDRQERAEWIARRIETGTTTIADAIWIRAEYGIQPKGKQCY